MSKIVLPGNRDERAALLVKETWLASVVAGKKLVPVTAKDVGAEDLDDYTLRITLEEPAPFFLGLCAHPFFRVVPRKTIAEFGNKWTDVKHIVTSGAFKLLSWEPYNKIIVVRNAAYWEAATVRLESIDFYPIEETMMTTMNLYKVGAVDAFSNHHVPVGWVDYIRPLKDYMDAPEAAIQYYFINTTKPPMHDVRVRKAFNMAIDKVALSAWRRTIKPLTAFTPAGIFPGYRQPQGDKFDPENARSLLAAAGYRDQDGKYDPGQFPVSEVELSYNTGEANKEVAEFVQQQWWRNLSLRVSLKVMETKTFLHHLNNREYKGFGKGAFSADYMDPNTFLSIFNESNGNRRTGWSDEEYSRLVNEANKSVDQQRRYALLAEAEAYLLAQQPIIPLYTSSTNWLKKPYVKGMYPNPGTLHAWKYVHIEPDRNQWDSDK